MCSYLIDSGDMCNGLLVKLNSSGNITSSYLLYLGGSSLFGTSIRIFFVQQTNDNGYILGGNIHGYGVSGYPNFFLVKLDSSFKIELAKIIGGLNSDYFGMVKKNNDGSYLAGGFTESYGPRSSNLLLAKLDSSGNISNCSAVQNVTSSIATTSPSISNITFSNLSTSVASSSYSISVSDFSLTSQNICP